MKVKIFISAIIGTGGGGALFPKIQGNSSFLKVSAPE